MVRRKGRTQEVLLVAVSLLFGYTPWSAFTRAKRKPQPFRGRDPWGPSPKRSSKDMHLGAFFKKP